MWSFDLKYSDVRNDDGEIKIIFFSVIFFEDLSDRSCVFYITHPSTGNIREFFSQWNLLSYDRCDLTTHIIVLVLTEMRANDRNLIITPNAEYNHFDASKIKIKEADHLFDIDPNNRKSNQRVYIDKEM
jgi:hypothetical protein